MGSINARMPQGAPSFDPTQQQQQKFPVTPAPGWKQQPAQQPQRIPNQQINDVQQIHGLINHQQFLRNPAGAKPAPQQQPQPNMQRGLPQKPPTASMPSFQGGFQPMFSQTNTPSPPQRGNTPMSVGYGYPQQQQQGYGY